MNQLKHDPISDYFTSDWATSCPLSSRFSNDVLQKIKVNRCKERLFILACLSIAFAGIAATIVFIYPGYKQLLMIQWQAIAAKLYLPFANVMYGLGNALQEAFVYPLKQPDSAFMVGLFTYPVLLAVVLWGVDWLIRRGHTFQH